MHLADKREIFNLLRHCISVLVHGFVLIFFHCLVILYNTEDQKSDILVGL